MTNACHTRVGGYPEHCITLTYEGLDFRLSGNDIMFEPTRDHFVNALRSYGTQNASFFTSSEASVTAMCNGLFICAGML